MADKPSPNSRDKDKSHELTQDRTETTPADAQRADGIRENLRNPDADDDSERDACSVVHRRNDEISDS